MSSSNRRQGSRIGGRQTAIAAAGLIVSAVAVFLVARSVDLAAAGRVITAAAPGPLLVGSAVFLVGLAFRILIWQLLLPTRSDGSRIRASRVTPVLMLGYLANVLLPARLGEIVRTYVIARREQIPFGGALGSVALERMVDTSVLAIIAFLAAVATGSSGWIVQGTALLAAAGAVLISILVTVGFRPFFGLLERLKVFAPARGVIEQVLRRLETFAYWSGGSHRRRVIGAAATLSVGAWLCNAALFWFVGQAVGAQLSPTGALLVMAIAVLATAIPSAPAYVGTFELAATTVAVSLGVPPDTALAVAVLTHVIGLLPTAIGGPIALAAIGGNLRRLSAAALDERRADGSHLAQIG